MYRHDPDRGPRGHHREHHGPGPGPEHGPMSPGAHDVMFWRRRFGGPGFGGPEFGGPGRGRGGMRRGEIRPLILAVLATKPMHGYEVIQALETQSGGRWRPSAGSVYPTLQQLADEGLVTSEEVDGRRTYTLTDSGRTAASAAPLPRRWADAASDEADVPKAGMQLMGAVMQVQRVGSAAARLRTIEILADARRELYRLLADDDGTHTADAAPSDDDAEANSEG